MLHCITCSAEIRRENTPVLHKGRTSSGGTVCTTCHCRLIQKTLESALNIPYLTDKEVIQSYRIAFSAVLLPDKSWQAEKVD